MILFIIVLFAVIAVMSASWPMRAKWQTGLSGLLSLALGVRAAGLATTMYLLPLLTSPLLAQESASKPADEKSVKAEDDSKSQTLAEAKTNAGKPDIGPPDIGPPTAPASTVGDDSATRTVSFITNVKYLAANRPAWLESPPAYEGSALKVAVKAGPYRTMRDCEPDLESEVTDEVAEFLNDHLNAAHASKFISFSLKDLRRRKVIREQFSEQLETSVGLMNQVHAQLVFDEPFQDEIEQRWSDLRAKSRLGQIGLGSGIVLMLLTTMFGFLRLDTATRGYYTGRLQFGAVATILGLVAASVLLTKWIPWM